MAKTRSRLTQPKGETISVGPEERAWFKHRRETKKLGQKELGVKVGASQGTISNLENGTHPQIKRSVYAGLRRVLGDFETTNTTDSLRRELDIELPGLAESDLEAVVALARHLKKSRQPAAPTGGADDTTGLDGDSSSNRRRTPKK